MTWKHNIFMASCLFAARGVAGRRLAFAPSLRCSQLNGLTRSRLFATVASATDTAKEPVPVTLLSGFLGSGKTSALKNLLENKEGLRIGVIVNDVAAVNIDAKLISQGGVGSTEGTVELQNGCACCSLADELLTSVRSLMDGRELDAVVVELSGVADPMSIKSNWQEAKLMNHPAAQMADMRRVVTVVDACTFGTDWMTWDKAGERGNWVEEGDDCSAQRMVPELLAEQVEAADLLLINKIDLAGDSQVKTAASVAQGLNAKADVFEVEYGKVSPSAILGDAVVRKNKEVSHSHEHHEHSHEEAKADRNDPDCKDSTHNHDHSHSHECSESGCTDPSHSHEHTADCTDPDCTDPSHSHSHDHANTATANLGISNFVYKSSRPFNGERLMHLLHQWPVPMKDTLDIGQLQEAQREGTVIEGKVEQSPFIGVLRSKGFCWMAPTDWSSRPGSDAWRHDTAFFWSHAGKHMGISTAGKWWGTISKERMKSYFTDNMKEYDRILAEDFVSEEWGDRRQELVFIGTNLDEEAITKSLDHCLATDKELKKYRRDLQNFIQTTLTVEAANSGPSLFDLDGTEHMDSTK